MNKHLLKNWLKAHRISISEFSKKTGISQTHLYEWMRGEYRITLHLASKISHATDGSISLEALAESEDELYTGKK